MIPTRFRAIAGSLLPVLLALSFWALLPLAGLPGPNICDDLVFVPPAIAWSHGGPMSNPQLHDLLAKWGMQTDHWYAHPPLAAFILGSWLRLFGVSAAAMFAFQVVQNCGVQLCFFWICRRLQLNRVWPFVLGLIFFVGTLEWGMRPEPLAFLFLLLGLAFLLKAPAHNLFVVSFLLSMAGGMVPQAGLFAAPLLLVSLGSKLMSDEAWAKRGKDLLLFVSGLLLTAGLFHLSIGGHWTDFLSDFRKHLQIGTGADYSRLQILLSYLHWMTFGFEWFRTIAMGGALFLIALAFRSPQKWNAKSYLIALLIGAFGTLVVSIPGESRLHLLFNMLCVALVLSLPLWRTDSVRRSLILPVALAVIGSLSALPGIAADFLRANDNRREIQNDLRSFEGQPVYCDSAAAWFVFDWKLPQSLQSLQLTNKFASVPFRPGAVTVVAESDLNNQPLRLLGHTFRSTSLNSRRWRILPASPELSKNASPVTSE